MADDVEEMARQQLEAAIREMFQFSGWDQDVDDDAADAVHKVEVALDRLDTVRAVKRAALDELHQAGHEDANGGATPTVAGSRDG